MLGETAHLPSPTVTCTHTKTPRSNAGRLERKTRLELATPTLATGLGYVKSVF